MALDLTALRKRYMDLRSQRYNFDTLWQEIADFVVPSRAKIVEQFSPGTKTTSRLYDGTAPHDLSIAASALHSSLTPSSVRWFSLQMRDHAARDDQDVMIWLDECTELMHAHFNQSNFDAEMQEIDWDMLAFGTACLFVSERELSRGKRFGGLRFEAIPPGSYTIAEDADGIVDTLFRCRVMSIRAAAQEWGAEKLSQMRQEHLKSNRGDEMIEIIQAILPRSDRPVERGGGSDVLPRNRPIASVIFEADPLHLIHEGGFHETPFMVPRWKKMSGEIYGRSPVMNALPDIRTLNRAVELRLSAWEMAVRPPVLIRDRGVVGDVRMRPGGQTYVRDQDAIREFVTQARFDVANFSEEQLRAQIHAALYVDQIQLAARPGTPISATEAAIRFETMQRILGPTVSRLHAELISVLINRTFGMLYRAGELPQPPETLGEGDGRIDVIFEGPLAKAQRTGDVDAVTKFVNIILPLGQSNPEVLDPVDFPEITRVVAGATGLPPKLLHSREEVQKIREARVQAQQAQQRQEAFGNIMGALGKAAPLAGALQGAQQGAPPEPAA